MAALIPFCEALRLDTELVRIARGGSALRLTVGEALDALASSGGHYELGFSSLEAYARERCERSGRWAADTRALARGLRYFPRTREALRSGAIGWSTAELLARHVSAESEGVWVEKARVATVRELRVLLAQAVERPDDEVEEEPARTLTVSVIREDAWIFECARRVAEAVADSMPADRLFQSLLAEGYSTLIELAPECAALREIDRLEGDVAVGSDAHAAWCAERKRWRDEAEQICEKRVSSLSDFDGREVRDIVDPVFSASGSPEVLDREIRRMCAELSERDLALGIVAESARKAEVWRRLGFATEVQYARERVGVSLSSLKAKRILAARAARVPELAEALSKGRVGYEAAYLLSRVVTPRTAEPWIRRAERRTVKHLREEVEAAELLIRAGQSREQMPLDEKSLGMLFELERRIVGGDLLERDRVTSIGIGAKQQERAGCQMSGSISAPAVAERERGEGNFGRATLRWRVTDKTFRFFRALEGVFMRVSTRVCREPVSFLRFLCENFCRIWLPALRNARLTDSGGLPEYYGVYRRDAFRCTSPVCTRRDVTPHHLVFRSHGGGDEDENVTSLCVWCHLSGVHEGRILAEPPAPKIGWRIGRSGSLRIVGRDRVLG